MKEKSQLPDGNTEKLTDKPYIGAYRHTVHHVMHTLEKMKECRG